MPVSRMGASRTSRSPPALALKQSDLACFDGRRRDGTRYFSSERAKLLIAKLSVAITNLADIAANRDIGPSPPLPELGLAVFGSSNLVYVARNTTDSDTIWTLLRIRTFRFAIADRSEVPLLASSRRPRVTDYLKCKVAQVWRRAPR